MAAADQECFVYVVLPGQTHFVTAGRFVWRSERRGGAVGGFVYGRSYRERLDAVELDPVELRLTPGPFQTARMGGFFGAVRDALPDFWGRQVIERKAGHGVVSDFELLLLGPDDRAGALGFGRNVEPPAPSGVSTALLTLPGFRRRRMPSSATQVMPQQRNRPLPVLGSWSSCCLRGAPRWAAPGPRPLWRMMKASGWRSFPGRMTAGISLGWNTPPCNLLATAAFRCRRAGWSGWVIGMSCSCAASIATGPLTATNGTEW